MTRIFWDAMLFIYLLEGNPEYAPKVRRVLAASRRRAHKLYSSHLSLAEALVGVPVDGDAAQRIRSVFAEMNFTLLPFAEEAVVPFQQMRRDYRLKQPDSMHLACAAAHTMDMFITGDKELLRKDIQVPGIHFIVGLDNVPF